MGGMLKVNKRAQSFRQDVTRNELGTTSVPSEKVLGIVVLPLHGARAVPGAAISGTWASLGQLVVLLATSQLLALIWGPKCLPCFSQLRVSIFLGCEHLKGGLCAHR